MTTGEYNQIVERYANHLYRYLLKNIRNEDRARDLVQDSFEKLWRNYRDISFSKAKSYLFSIAHNTMIDMIRREKRMMVADTSEMPELSHSKQYSDLKEILDEGLKKLPEVQRSVLLLRDYEGYSYEEIGKISNLNESQVKVYIYRARVFLKNYIGQIEKVL
ncbi:MAG: RNA polymerase sigma factor [Prolixibacteraceae bacterium]|nr:RNA polymerase sigma factor [Prolixibacteraceae bacterium]MBN2649694.1 RNA polymerase sigma factor [Prolixibacteraceae bacterium]